MQVLWGIGGMAILLAIAFLLSTDRRTISPRTVIGALAIQVANLMSGASTGMLV